MLTISVLIGIIILSEMQPMTSYREQWSALAARIRGLERAGTLHARFLSFNSSDPDGRGKRLIEHCQRIVDELTTFRDGFSELLPPKANNALIEFLSQTGERIKAGGGVHSLSAALVLLVAFEAEMTFLLSDQQELIRSRTELAFIHLQRLIAVDDDYRQKWINAFETGEVKCEQLGAVHLLWHGILAFKADAAGARTDLILPEPLDPIAQRAAIGLVLTEWKVAKKESEAEQRFSEARTQADLYKQGALAGMELAGYRYVVVVSEKRLTTPADLVVGGVIYRHINIAVDPHSPSVAARRSAT